MNDNQKKGNTVLLTVIAVATLLVAVVGATFAYFTASVQGNNTASSVIVNTATLGNIVYENGDEIKMDNAYPGAYSNEIEFTISAVDNTVALPYDIRWVNVTNSFNPTSELVYTLSSEKTGSGTLVDFTEAPGYDEGNSYATAPTAAGIIGSGSLGIGGDTHTYTMQVHFLETASNQNSNQGKSFVGKIEVTTSGSGDIYYNDQNQSGTTTAPTSAY